MKTSTLDNDYFAEFDRRQRGIEIHLVVAFFAGLAVGLAGMLGAGRIPGWLGQIYDPYAYLALTVAVGATASGFGWALLTTFLAVVATVVAAMGGGALRGTLDPALLGGTTAGLYWTVALLVGVGLLAYVTRRSDRWGDLAAGAIGALLVIDVVGRATNGFAAAGAYLWPLPASLVVALTAGGVLLMRRTAPARARTLAISAVAAGTFILGLTVLPA
ncbi:hypothetical protein OUY22_29795 [Nonomuraea sp. MCN248]|uniref:Uncharacterized protein n=1 Tax=Nonomuraea corallina TaxID=2989783 RepID=A0ABT4SK67_9ACTN|nr:hypothetical protein [Nonomuraea corallina]MDA0637621.1 hypothetical protein [Nonomuraea corallina]